MLYKSLSQQQHKKEKKNDNVSILLSVYVYVELALEEVVCFDAEKKLILI